MIAYFAQSTHHLAPLLPIPQGNVGIAHFSDGELQLTIDPIAPQQEIWVIGSTRAPAENSLELLLLLEALTHAGAAKINLMLLYTGYARQAHGARLFCRMLTQFPLEKVVLIHPHNPTQLAQWLPFANLIPIDFFSSIAADYDVIVAPDRGAIELAQSIATQCNKQLLLLQKKRDYESVSISSANVDLTDKKILIVDDILATGTTLHHAAILLADQGAEKIAAAVTHGLFTGNAHELLATAPIAQLYVTNTLAQVSHPSVAVYDVSHLLRGFFLPSSPS